MGKALYESTAPFSFLSLGANMGATDTFISTISAYLTYDPAVDDELIQVANKTAEDARLKLEEFREANREAVESRLAIREKHQARLAELARLEDAYRDAELLIESNIYSNRQLAESIENAKVARLASKSRNERLILAPVDDVMRQYLDEHLELIDANVSAHAGRPSGLVNLKAVMRPFRFVQAITGLRSIERHPKLTFNLFQVANNRIGSAELRVEASTSYGNTYGYTRFHPHIRGNSVCLGDTISAVHSLINDNKSLEAVALAVRTLLTVNTRSTYNGMYNLTKEGNPWLSPVCEHCNAIAVRTSLVPDACAHRTEATILELCTICLERKTILHCGTCQDCCTEHHEFNLASLEANAGCNNSGCQLRRGPR